MPSTVQSTENLPFTILDTSLNGIVVAEIVENHLFDVVDYRYVLVNKTAREQAALLKNVRVGGTLKEALTDADFKRIFLLCHTVRITGHPYQGERYYADMDEWFQLHIARLNDRQLVITFTNISESKRAVFRHQQEADLFQSVLGSTTNPIVVGKPVFQNETELIDFEVVLFNPAAQYAWLFGPALQIGATATSLLPPSEREAILTFCREAYLSGETQRFQYRYPNTDRWYNLVVQRFNQGVILNATDITEERQQQRVLRQMNQELQQSNENLQQFASIASHDLQEPLRKIQSFGKLLQSQFAEQLGPTGTDLIARMQAASGRMATLIQDLLTYSRLTTHRQPFRSVSLGRLIDEIIDDLEPLMQEGQAIVDCDALPTVPGDASQLRQLFQNLLINAVKFCQPGQLPKIQVQCRMLEAHDMPEELPAHGRYAEISVTDNGIGFDERYLDRIFQMFQRLHGRSQYEGTGVGLAICKRIVENHQGLITAQSVLGAGSTFRVILPLETTAEMSSL